MAAKVNTDMIKPFSGEGDVVAWIKKVNLVAKLQKITNTACFIPLFLEGDALALYLQMEDSDQVVAKAIEEKLVGAFSDSAFVAYCKMVQKRWNGESVDVYSNELMRLAGVAGFSGDNLQQIVKLGFVTGLPENISAELQQVQDVLNLPMSNLIDRARILTNNVSRNFSAAVSDVSENSGGKTRQFRGKCFRCEGPHMARFCPDKTKIICFKCGVDGHISTHCTNDSRKQKSQGNE